MPSAAQGPGLYLRLARVAVGLDEDGPDADVLAHRSQRRLHGLARSQDRHPGDLQHTARVNGKAAGRRCTRTTPVWHWVLTVGDSNGQPQSTSLPRGLCRSQSRLAPSVGGQHWHSDIADGTPGHRPAACPNVTGYGTHDGRHQTRA